MMQVRELGVHGKLDVRTNAMLGPSRLNVHWTSHQTHRAGANPMSERQQHRMKVRMLPGAVQQVRRNGCRACFQPVTARPRGRD